VKSVIRERDKNQAAQRREIEKSTERRCALDNNSLSREEKERTT